MIDRIIRFFTGIPQRLRGWFSRKPDHFIERLRQQCALGTEATAALIDYMEKPSKKNAQRVRQLEKDADELLRMLVDELNRTFVTPIDREDLYKLSRAVDDILDDTWFTINEMDILEVEPNAWATTLAWPAPTRPAPKPCATTWSSFMLRRWPTSSASPKTSTT